jgi:outer membrane murein-binding lipoprotein Lpp
MPPKRKSIDNTLSWANDLISRIDQLQHTIDDLRAETMSKVDANDLEAKMDQFQYSMDTINHETVS